MSNFAITIRLDAFSFLFYIKNRTQAEPVIRFVKIVIKNGLNH